MWFYIQTWFSLLTIALTAAICFSVAYRSSPVSRVSRLHMLPREKIEAEIAYLEIVGRKDGRQRHCSDLA